MRPYPKLSEEAYSDEIIHRAEVMEAIASITSDMLRYYTGTKMSDQEVESLQKQLNEILPVKKPEPLKQKQITKSHIIKIDPSYHRAIINGQQTTKTTDS
jgi:hypothetical protein